MQHKIEEKKDWVPFGITTGPDTTNQNLQTIGCSAGIPAENCEFIDFQESLPNRRVKGKYAWLITV